MPRLADIYSLHDIDYVAKQPGLKTLKERLAIQALNVTSNNISILNIKRILSVFPQLTSLNLQNNSISTLDCGTLCYMPDNFKLDLKNNPITGVADAQFERHPKKCIVRLSCTSNQKDEHVKKMLRPLNSSSNYALYDKPMLFAQLASFALLLSRYFYSFPTIENVALQYLFVLACLVPPSIDCYVVCKKHKAAKEDNVVVFE